MKEADRTREASPFAGFSESFRRLAGPLAAYKAMLLLSIPLGTSLLPPIFSQGAYAGNFHWPIDKPAGADTFFMTWDAQHYLYLSRHWYAAGSQSVRFFPLWPLCIRLGALFASPLLSGLILANLFSLLGFVLLHALVTRESGADSADMTVLLLLAFPAAFFFAVPYSESLFFFLIMLFFAFLSRKRFAAAGAVSFLLGLARAPGLLVLPMFVYEIVADRKKNGLPRLKNLVWAAGPLVGFAVYLALVHAATGDAWSGFKAFDAGLAHPVHVAALFDVFGFLRLLLAGWPGAPWLFVFDRFFFVIYVLTLLVLWKEEKRLLWYALPMGLIPIVTGSFYGGMRYLLAVFPAFIVGGRFFAKKERKAWAWVALAAMFVLQIFLMIRHVNNLWVD